ncbi:MAG: metallophosphoesterase [Ruminococcaceae bacterium]|nr:metallophosphoesterase [Oscillospiraceae bacterium]
MNILVISDTHGETQDAVEIIKKHNPDIVFHLGDLVSDAQKIREAFDKEYFYFVSGNNDYFQALNEQNVEFEGKRIFACHGHHYGVKNGLSYLYNAAKERKADIVLFGHTHMPLVTYMGNILVVNPGCLNRRYSKKGTYSIVTVQKDKINAQIFLI